MAKSREPREPQRVLDSALEVPVGRLDRAVLMGDATVVAAGGHAVVGAERVVSGGPVLLRLDGQVAERGGEAVAAVLARRATESPECILQSCGQRHEALAAKHDMSVLEAAEGQAEVIEPVRQRGPRDRHASAGHVGEVGQAHPARLVGLAEDHLPLRAMQRAPLADAPLQGPPNPQAQLGMPAHHLLEDRHRPQPRARLQHRDNLSLEDGRQGIGPAPLAWRVSLRGRSRTLGDAIAGGGAEPGAGGGHGDRGVRSMRHEEPHLAIGHMAAGHERSSKAETASV